MTPRVPPGPKGRSAVRYLKKLQKDPIGLFVEGAARFGDIFQIRYGPLHYYFLFHPEAVARVLRSNFSNYGKQTPEYDYLRRLMGQGLITSDGKLWRRERRIAQPAFHREIVESFAPTMTRAVESLLERWEHLSGHGEAVELFPAMAGLTLRILGKTLFSVDIRDAESLSRALTTALGQLAEFASQPIRHSPRRLPGRQGRVLKKAVASLDRAVSEIIASRRRERGERRDLLALLMSSMKEPRLLRDQIMTLLLAGHETTATTLSWTWYLLWKHPSARRRLQRELRETLGGRPPVLDDLPRLKYVRMVIQEAMRLYPPVWMLMRSVAEDDEIAGYRVEAGSLAVLSPYWTHRHPDFWSEPERFKPERFETGRALPHRFAYFPFLEGPRQCLGKDFAMMEMLLVVASIAQRFDLDLPPGTTVKPAPGVTLRPAPKLMMRLKPRES